MKTLRTRKPKPTLLTALELLDDMVRRALGASYLDSTMHEAVADAIRRAKKRSQPQSITPRDDQLRLLKTEE
jgi:hypothetical protein